MSSKTRDLKYKRRKYLLSLYDRTEGDKLSIVNMWDVGKEANFSKEEIDPIVDYLESEGLLAHATLGGGISITHLGILRAEKEIDELESSHDQDHPILEISETANSIQSQLKENLKAFFDETDIKELCFDLNIDYEDLSGETKRAKIMALITYTRNQGRLQDLWDYSRRLRPNLEW